MSAPLDNTPSPMKNKKLGTSLSFTALVIVLATAGYWFYLVNQVALPGSRTLFVVAFVTAVVMGIASFFIGTRWFGGIAAALAIVAGSFMPLTVAINKQQVAENPLAVGDLLPRFTAINDKGERFNSESLAGSPALIKFFRGHW